MESQQEGWQRGPPRAASMRSRGEDWQCATTIKINGPRGSYGNNTGYPWTIYSGKDPYSPLEKPKPRQRQPPHSTPTPIHSLQPRRMEQEPPLASTLALGAATARIWRTPGSIPLTRRRKERRPKFSHPQSRPPLPRLAPSTQAP